MSALVGKRRLVAAIILVLVAVVATESVALAATVVRQGPVGYIKVATADGAIFDALPASPAWTDVPSTALALSVPSGEHDFFVLTFSTGETQCYRFSTTTDGVCYVRAVFDGKEGSFGSVPWARTLGPASTFANSMQWMSPVFGPGTHYAKLQVSVTNAGIVLRFARYTTTVIRARAY